jgi:tellurite resistance protein TerC
MLLKIDVYYIPTTISLAVIATILGVSVWASLRATRGQGRRAVEAPAAPPFSVATEEQMAEVEPLWRRGGRDSRRDTPEPTRTP